MKSLFGSIQNLKFFYQLWSNFGLVWSSFGLILGTYLHSRILFDSHINNKWSIWKISKHFIRHKFMIRFWCPGKHLYNIPLSYYKKA